MRISFIRRYFPAGLQKLNERGPKLDLFENSHRNFLKPIFSHKFDRMLHFLHCLLNLVITNEFVSDAIINNSGRNATQLHLINNSGKIACLLAALLTKRHKGFSVLCTFSYSTFILQNYFKKIWHLLNRLWSLKAYLELLGVVQCLRDSLMFPI